MPEFNAPKDKIGCLYNSYPLCPHCKIFDPQWEPKDSNGKIDPRPVMNGSWWNEKCRHCGKPYMIVVHVKYSFKTFKTVEV